MNPGNEANGWERPPEYDDPPDPPEECNKCLDECRCPPADCLGCGRCGACVQRSAAFAAELNDGYDAPHPDDEFDDDPPDPCPHCDGTGWQDCGVVAIECPECGGEG